MISRSKILTDKEKKLQVLRQQLYGKEPTDHVSNRSNSSTFSFKSQLERPANPQINGLLSSETNYLKKDLIKILCLATIAFLSQLAIYFSINRGLLKF